MSFTTNGRSFQTVSIARRVVVDGWTYVPPADDRWDGEKGCTFLVPNAYYDFDDQPVVGDCGAEAAYDNDHFVCANGHEHTSMQARHDAGWDYAEDAYDAAVISRGGKDYRPVGPNTHIDSREVADLMRAI